MTLIELLIAISIASLVFGVVLLTLQTSLDTFHFVQDDIFLQKVLDETLDVLSEGDFESYGLKDALEIIFASSKSISFVPLWVDEGHFIDITNPDKRFTLSRPFRAGTPLPIGEVEFKQKKGNVWRPQPIIFFLGGEENGKQAPDQVSFVSVKARPGKARFLYHPDASFSDDVIMTIRPYEDHIVRTYRKKTQAPVPLNNLRNVSLKDINFKYFDNSNTEIRPDPASGKIPQDQLVNITAVKLSLSSVIGNKSKKGSVFINLRNTRSSGAGLLIRKGTKVRIPNSQKVRAFSLLNIMGVKEGGKIVLQADSKDGQSWRLTIELGTKDGKEVITRYGVDFPAGSRVFSETVNLTTDLPLNLMTLGATGRWDYDIDPDTQNMVDLTGEVTLSVLEMDAAGAALFIRP